MAKNTDITVDHCIHWTTPNINGAKSTPFFIGNIECHLQYVKLRNFDCDYRLYLLSERAPDKPFDLSVQLIIGTEVASHCRTTFPLPKLQATLSVAYSIIWKGRISELSKVDGFFDQRELIFKIVVQDCNASGYNQGTAADKSVQTPTYIDTKFELENLSRDFARLLEDDGSSQADVELACGDRTLKAHGSVLSVRSDVFRAMLQTDMRERKTGRVEIRDTEPDLFEDFLKYMYTGFLPDLTVNSAMRLYEIGDRYSIAGIKERCASFLTDNLSRHSACAILHLADQHNDLEFKEHVISYILDHKIPLWQERWSSFSKAQPQLAVEVYDRFLKLHIDKLI